MEIQPGVIVQFQSNYVFQITGFLMANGSALAPILFTTTNASAGGQGVFFNEVAPGSSLGYCIIEGSKKSGIRIKDCKPEIQNCTVRNNSSSGGGGVQINNTFASLGELTLSSCTISNNQAIAVGGGISANMGPNLLRLIGCTIVGNTVNNGGGLGAGGGVSVSGDSAFGSCLVAGNSCSGCPGYGGGIYSSGGDAMFRNTTITNNSSFGCGSIGGGIYLEGGSFTNLNCVISFNHSSSGVGDIHLSTPGPVLIQNCITTYNDSGIYFNNSGPALIQNCIIAFNNGMGVYKGSGAITVQNCTVVNNGDYGLSGNTSNPILHNSIFYFNRGGSIQINSFNNPSVSFCDVQGGFAGTNNIAVNIE